MTDTKPRLFDATFARLALVAAAYFVAMGSTFPVLPRFVRDEVGASDTGVGVVLGAMAVGAIVARPAIGYIGDRRGRVILMIGGGLISAAAMAAHLLADSIGVLMALRMIFGAGQGAMVVGATTMAVDLAPEDRSGEATSYIFVALHLGSGFGTVLGEWVRQRWSFDAVWVIAAVTMTTSAGIAATLPRMRPAIAPQRSVGLLHPKAILPGVILGIGITGFIGFSSFVPLFADDLGIGNVAPFFLASSLTIVAIRGFGARLPDRLGPVRGGTLALTLSAVGLLVMGIWRTGTGLAAGTIVLAAGTALLLPSLLPAAVDGVRLTERSRALATYTLFLELSSALGAVLFGGVASVSSYGNAFVVSAGFVIAALVLLRVSLGGANDRDVRGSAA